MTIPKVSVLLPIFNGEKGVVKTIKSIISQTYTNYELVIVDDGSTDRTVPLAKETLPSATIISQKNGGIAKALNTGSKYCKGQYIARIDCNDIALPHRFEKQVMLLDKNDRIGAVGGHMLLYDNSKTIIGTYKFPTNSQSAIDILLSGASPVPHTGSMIRKEALTKVGGYDEFYNGREDFELWCRLSLISDLTNVDEVVVKSLSITEGISFNALFLYPLVDLALRERAERVLYGLNWQNREARKHCQKQIDISRKSKLSQNINRNTAKFICKRATVIYKSGERKYAFKQYLLAAQKDPSYFRPWLGMISIGLPLSLYAIAATILRRLFKNIFAVK